MDVYTIKGVTFSYPESETPVLKDISLQIQEGDFIVLCGESGSGKTTFLQHLKTALTPHGSREGEIFYFNRALKEVEATTQVTEIGFVSQQPENQVVTDKVWHELAFGLENLGYDSSTIRLRVAEMASFFGIQHWFEKDVSDLSGGQKQLLNLASVMAMQPKVLLLDEPTSQLDPIAATDFLETLKKINQDLGVTIILSEHRLEEAFVLADKVIVMEKGQVLAFEPPRKIGENLKQNQSKLLSFLPTAMQIYAQVTSENQPCPITVRDGRKFLNTLSLPERKKKPHVQESGKAENTVLEFSNVYFKHEKNLPDVLSKFTLKVPEGKIYALLGGNGTGKTTTLSLMVGLKKPYRGKITTTKKTIALLPQNPQSLFVKKTVLAEFEQMTKNQQDIEKITHFTKMKHLLHQHPYDLSGGEQQRLALGKVLLLQPDILLLDEPTKALDNQFKATLGDLLQELRRLGTSIVLVSHDVEFCAKYADVCGLMFQGQVVSEGVPKTFFTGNNFYTTQANRMARHLYPEAITIEEVVSLCNHS